MTQLQLTTNVTRPFQGLPADRANNTAPDSLSDTEAARIESHIRNYMIADAAGAAEWENAEIELDNAFQRASKQFAEPVSPIEVRQLADLLIGRICCDVLVPHKPNILAVIGSGTAAETHLAAALSQRSFETVRIYARQPVAANLLAKKFRNRHKSQIEIAASPEAAVHKADMIILATGAHRPEIDSDWVVSGAHITCALPQTVTAHELPLEMIARSKTIASDYPQFIGKCTDHLVGASYAKRRIIHLGAMIDRFEPDRSRGTTIFLNSGAQELCLPVLSALT